MARQLRMITRTVTAMALFAGAALLLCPPVAHGAVPTAKDKAKSNNSEPGSDGGTASALVLRKLTFARKVEKRQPVEEGTRFAADSERIYAFAELSNPGDSQRVTMHWAKDGRVRFRYSLKVGRSRKWRTWSYLRAGPRFKGEWTVTVNDADGNQLGSSKLTIGEPAS